jgi:hypothetical protein
MEHSLIWSFARRVMPLAGLILAAAWTSPGGAASSTTAGNPFDELSGDWKGGGRVILADGERKEVSCSETYKVAGSKIVQTLRCTGSDYEISTTLKLTYKDGKIKGSWNESIYDANGSVIGTAKDDTIHARISGDKFSGRMSVKVSDTGHSINIVQLNSKSGTYRLATSLTLRR